MVRWIELWNGVSATLLLSGARNSNKLPKLTAFSPISLHTENRTLAFDPQTGCGMPNSLWWRCSQETSTSELTRRSMAPNVI